MDFFTAQELEQLRACAKDEQALNIILNLIADKLKPDRAMNTDLIAPQFAQTVLNTIPEIIYIFDLVEHRNIYANREIIDILGYSPEQIQTMGTGVYSLIHADDVPQIQERQKHYHLLADGESSEYEIRLKHADGQWRWLYARSSVFSRLADGTVHRIIGVAQDITARKHLELELAHYRREFQSILDNAPTMIFIKDLESRYLMANKYYCKINNLKSEDIVGKTPEDIYPYESAQILIDNDRMVIRTGKPLEVEEEIMMQGELRMFTSAKFLLRDENDKAYALCGISSDITELKQVQDALMIAYEEEAHISQLRSRFMSMASHEFRNPLATILSSSNLLQHYFDKLDEARRLHHLNKIEQQVNYMVTILDDVLILGRIQEGELGFRASQFEVNIFLENIVENFQLVNENRDIQYFPLDEPLYWVGDEKMFQQAIGNLLANAIKYSDASKPVEIRTKSTNASLIISVQDYGIGIPPQEVEKLFDAFYRATNVGNIKGTGLGLAIAYHAVNMHDGTIVCISEVGKGTNFTITLPLIPPNVNYMIND